MNRGMLAIAVMLFLCWTAPVLAETPAGAATYRVTIVLYPGDDPAAVAKRLAAMYRGTLETPVDGNGSFTISLSDAGAGLMCRDPMVAEMDSPSLALPAATTSGSATAALPVSQRPVETNATTSWSLGAYQYDGSGNIRRIGSEFYVYDQLGRIVVSADAQPSVVHKQTYTYDPYGNVRSINTAGRGAMTLVMTGVSNRLASVSSGSTSAPVGYDGSGNFVSYLGATYEYDALNMMRKSVAGGVTRSYVYTASDERIGTIEQTGSTVRSDWTIRDSGGQVLRRYSKESNGEWKWQEDYIYRGTQMLAAEIPDSPKTRHFHLDHLGTPPPDHRQRRRRGLTPHLPPLRRGDRPQRDGEGEEAVHRPRTRFGIARLHSRAVLRAVHGALLIRRSNMGKRRSWEAAKLEPLRVCPEQPGQSD